MDALHNRTARSPIWTYESLSAWLSINATWLELLGAVVGMGLLLDAVEPRLSASLANFVDAWSAAIGARLVTISLILGLVAALLIKRKLPTQSIGLEPREAGRQIVAGMLLLPAVTGVWLLGVLAVGVLGEVGWLPRLPFGAGVPAYDGRRVLLLVANFVVAAAVEETVIRGLILTRVYRLTKSWVAAVAVSALLFALGHDSGPSCRILHLSMGIGFSLVFVWTRSLIAVTVAHLLFNICVTWVLPRFL